MSTRVHVPDDLAERLATEAQRRHMSVDELATELVAAGLDDAIQPRRRLSFVAIGASGSSRGGAEADELLAEGFGRD